jgi:tetratricopeptide (TPR) repeat protein
MKRTIFSGVLVLAAVVPAMAEMKVKSKGEAEAVQALIAAEPQGPDAIIAAAEALLGKFADTQFKEVALLAEATAFQQKKDFASAELTNERILEIDPKNPQAAMQLGEVITAHVGENDLDKDERLAKAEKALNQAVANIDHKPSEGMPDDAWAGAKKFTLAQAENDLGLAAMLRKNYPAAAAAFQLAVDSDPQPAYEVRLALSDQKGGKNDEALALCEKLLADPQLHPSIKKVTQGVELSIAWAYQQSGKNDEALAICDKLLADPNLDLSIKKRAQGTELQMASAYQQSGKNDAALAICAKLLADPALDPNTKQGTQSVQNAATLAKAAAAK